MKSITYKVFFLLVIYTSCSKDKPSLTRDIYIEKTSYIFDFYKTRDVIKMINISGLRNSVQFSYDTTYLYISKYPNTGYPEYSGYYANEWYFMINRKNIQTPFIETKVLIKSVNSGLIDTLDVTIQGYSRDYFALSQNVVDATLVPSKNSLVFISDSSSFKLYVYSYTENTLDSIGLTDAPRCVAVSSDGAYCAIGYDYKVSLVNLNTMTIENEHAVSGKIISIAITKDKWIYAFPLYPNWSEGLHCINIAQNIDTITNRFSNTATAQLSYTGNSLYAVDGKLHIFNILNHYPRLIATNYDISDDHLLQGTQGRRFYIHHGVYLINSDTAIDLQYKMSLAELNYPLAIAEFLDLNKILFLNHKSYPLSNLDNSILVFDYSNLDYIGELDDAGIMLPNSGKLKFREIETKFIFSNSFSPEFYTISRLKNDWKRWFIQKIYLN